MTILLKNARIINENQNFTADLLIKDGLIHRIGDSISEEGTDRVIDASGKYLLPGVIDDQVHFREPGLIWKGDIFSESRAAVAGGITSYIEQPNTVPNAVTQEILGQKYALAAGRSFANYSFMMGGANDNLAELLKTNPRNVAGIKLFLGSSTGNMLVDDPDTLRNIFSKTDLLIAVHCEDEETIRRNIEIYREKYGDDVPVSCHPLIRSAEACYISSSAAVKLAEETGARLHVFHVSTAKETDLFPNDIPLQEKKITAEVCVHHLTFSDRDYEEKSNFIKWNPAIKTENDREALWKALLDDRIDVIATDHAPHTLEEKSQPYLQAPSGGPLVQHSLRLMLEHCREGRISLEKIVEKMCHNPALIFQIEKRGFIREGYHADLVLVDLDREETVSRENILYKCGWSPLEGKTLHAAVTHTFVNGNVAYEEGIFPAAPAGKRLLFDRPEK